MVKVTKSICLRLFNLFIYELWEQDVCPGFVYSSWDLTQWSSQGIRGQHTNRVLSAAFCSVPLAVQILCFAWKWRSERIQVHSQSLSQMWGECAWHFCLGAMSCFQQPVGFRCLSWSLVTSCLQWYGDIWARRSLMNHRWEWRQEPCSVVRGPSSLIYEEKLWGNTVLSMQYL